MDSYSQPSVPSVYFETHRSNVRASTERSSSELPSELLSLCLTNYANWGDLAKLACVQKSWSNIVVDTATQSSLSQWELAVALLNGDCGLEKSPERAVRILKTLSHVAIDESTGQPIGDKKYDQEENSSSSSSNNQNHCTMAMKKLAECYLEGTGVSQD